MTSYTENVRSWILQLRDDAVVHDAVLTFEMLPLYVVVAPLLADGELVAAYAEAVAEDWRDMEELDQRDQEQTSRLEDSILRRTNSLISLSELISIEWWDGEVGPSSISIVAVCSSEGGFLVIHDHHAKTSFQAVGFGPICALQQIATESADLIFPRFASATADLREVVVRDFVPWTRGDVSKIVHAVTGANLRDGDLHREDLLEQSTEKSQRCV